MSDKQNKKPANTFFNIDEILNYSEEIHHSKGEYIFHEEDRNLKFYLILEGKIEISKKESDGKSKIFAELHSGEIIGEGILSGIFIKPASAKAVTECKLLALSKENFDKLMNEDTKAGTNFLLSVIASLNLRLRKTNFKFFALHEINTVMNIYGDDLDKLAEYLIKKLLVIFKSDDGILCIKNSFTDSYRSIYSSSDKISLNTFDDFDKTTSRIVTKDEYQYMFVKLKEAGFLAIRCLKADKHYEDDQLRLLMLTAEQIGNIIESAYQHASEKARDLLHRKRFVL